MLRSPLNVNIRSLKPVLYIISLHCYFHTHFSFFFLNGLFINGACFRHIQNRINEYNNEEEQSAFIFYSLHSFLNFHSHFSFFDSRRSCTRTSRMGTRTATNSLVKRTAFSSAINIFPNEVSASVTPEIVAENESTKNAQIRPYTEVPGPKGLPLIGNSWRFAPLIGETFSRIYNFFF